MFWKSGNNTRSGISTNVSTNNSASNNSSSSRLRSNSRNRSNSQPNLSQETRNSNDNISNTNNSYRRGYIFGNSNDRSDSLFSRSTDRGTTLRSNSVSNSENNIFGNTDRFASAPVVGEKKYIGLEKTAYCQLVKASENKKSHSKTDIDTIGIQDVNTVNTCEESTDCCSICWNEYTDDDIVAKLSCKHFFHEMCLSTWINKSATCPYCRMVLRKYHSDFCPQISTSITTGSPMGVVEVSTNSTANSNETNIISLENQNVAEFERFRFHMYDFYEM